MKKQNLTLVILIIILINIGCDQGTKHYARKHFKNKGQIEIIDSFFVIKYTENKGGFLSLASDLPGPLRNALLLYLPVIVLSGMIIYLIFNSNLSVYAAVCLASLLGGGLSNIIDRIIFDGQVTDFLNFGIGCIRTGILNLADISITFGAIAFVYFSVKKNRETVE